MATTTDKSTRRRPAAPKFEVILILILFGCFIIWSISRCNAKRQAYQQEERIRKGEDTPTAAGGALSADATAKTTVTETTTTVIAKPPVTKPTPPPKAVGSVLYITIDNLNMRDYPHLDSVVTAKLPLFEKVTFMNEVTEFKQEINLGKEMANEPWVKIQTKRGQQGWVYGAGVHYHKKKREGVE